MGRRKQKGSIQMQNKGQQIRTGITAAVLLSVLLTACGSTEGNTDFTIPVEPIPDETTDQTDAETTADEAASSASTDLSDPATPGYPMETSEDLTLSPAESAGYILLGDSRTVGMYWGVSGDKSLHTVQRLVNDSVVFDAKEGIGMDWMNSDGIPAMEPYIGHGTRIAILMGVNDIGGSHTAEDYVTFLNTVGKTWAGQGAKVFYVSVNPIHEEAKPSSSSLTNDAIDAWNEDIRDGLDEGVSWIETNSLLKDNPEQIIWHDWLHYEPSYNLFLYQTVLNAMQQ